jgi:hypothetical protein
MSAERLARLRHLAGLRNTGGDMDRRLRVCIAEIEDWIRQNPDGSKADRAAAINEACHRHRLPDLAELGLDG